MARNTHSEEIEDHLPEQGILSIFNQPRKPGPKGVIVQMGKSEILLHDIPDLGNSFISLDFIRR